MNKKSSDHSELGGGYRSRTGDPLHAMQMLWPAELIPQGRQK